MIHKKQKILIIIEELKKLEKQPLFDIDNVKLSYQSTKRLEHLDKADSSWESYENNNSWGEYDLSAWFSFNIDHYEADKDFILELWTKKEGWDAVNPQFLLFRDEDYKCSFDINHREYILANGFKNEKLYLHAYSGLKKNYKPILNIRLSSFYPVIRNYRITLETIFNSLENLSDDDFAKIKNYQIITESLSEIEFWNKNNIEEFQKTILKADEIIQQCYGVNSVPKVLGIGHTHIDVAWQWTTKQSREKAARSFTNALYLMDIYPEYKFISSQPILYKYIKEDHPDLYERIKEKIKTGQWEVDGAMYVESDCILTSGESLIRQIIEGKKFFKDEFGIDSTIVWLPDAFGYSPILPQIFKKCGIEYFMTTKISWNRYNKFPYDLFNWKGIDGSEIFSYMITTPEPNQTEKSHFATYNGFLTPETVNGTWDRFGQKDITDNVLTCYGYGDGGGGTTTEMIEIGKRLEKGIAGTPKFEFSTAKNFFETIKADTNNKNTPVWDGELYLEYHRGTYTSLGKNKLNNRKLERKFYETEILSFLLNKNFEFNSQENVHMENFLINQFHDILPGSSIKAVYDQTDVEYEAALTHFEKLDKTIITDDKVCSDYALFNPDNFDKDDFVTFDVVPNEANCISYSGELYPLQPTHDGKFITFIKNIKKTALTEIKFANDEKFNIIKLYDLDNLKGKNFKVVVNNEGEISNLKWNNRELVKECNLNVFKAFEDIPYENDNWDIEEYYIDKKFSAQQKDNIKVIESGPIRTVLAHTKTILNSTIKQKIIVSPFTNRIDFETDIDWQQSQVLLKVFCQPDINTSKAQFDCQFGYFERNTHKNTNYEQARFEVWHHKWVNMHEHNFGFSIFNDSKYGSSIDKNEIGLTLIKSGIFPNEVSDVGQHNIKHSIYLHDNEPMYKIDNESKLINFPTKFFNVNSTNEQHLAINEENIDISSVSTNNNHHVVRLFEKTNSYTECEIVIPNTINKVVVTDMLENNLEALEIIDNKVKLVFKPFEIITLKLIKE